MAIKQIIVRWSPKWFVRSVRTILASGRLTWGYAYDYMRFLRYSSSDWPEKHRENLRARITERYHNVEKGLSLPNPRPRFGATKIPALVDYIQDYIELYGADEFIRIPIGVLSRYADFNRLSSAEDYPGKLRIERLVSIYLPDGPALETGTRFTTRDEILASTLGTKSDFFLRRHSVRQFSDREVDLEDLAFAAVAAAKAPAVCNRQSGKAYFTRDPERVAELLRIQGGASGFGAGVRAVVVLTANLRNFWNVGERNQVWIDGGLFAMSFLLGLHARGLGAVPLNWSKEPKKDRELRRAIELPDHEAIIFLVGVGHLPDTLEVAHSWRPPMDQVLVGLDT